MRRAEPIRIAAAAAVLVALVLALPGDARANVDSERLRDRLDRIERAICGGEGRGEKLDAERARLAGELDTLRHRSVALAAAIQQAGDALADQQARLHDLQTRQFAAEGALQDRRIAWRARLGALTRLQRRPAGLVILGQRDAVDALRAARLLRAAVRALEGEAAALRGAIGALIAVRRDIEAAGRILRARADALDRQTADLDLLLATKAELHGWLDAESGRHARLQQRLSHEAADLRGLLRQLNRQASLREAERRRIAAASAAATAAAQANDARTRDEGLRGEVAARAPASGVSGAPDGAGGAGGAGVNGGTGGTVAGLAPSRSFAESRGALPIPARGRILRHFGAVDRFGQPMRGLTMLTRSLAQVVTPYAGEVVYAGPFRSYGHLLIIAHGEGYHTLLAGMDRLYPVVGQFLLAGEPVGRMGRASGEKATLYVELRRNGEPINPLPWWAATGRKVSG